MKGNLFCWSLALSLALVNGCQPRKKQSLNVLNVGGGADLSALDPQIVDGKIESYVIEALFEGLVTQDPKTLEIRPGMASHWECSADGLEYSFSLREGLRWSNGDPFTAEDFVFSLKRALSPNLGSPWTPFFFTIRNAEAYYKGQVSDFREVGMRVVDAQHLKIRLERPVAYFLELVAHSAWFPVHKKTIEKFGSIEKRDTRWTRPENMVCNGPFVLSSWESGRFSSVKKNPYYWDKESVALDEIRFHPVSDTATEERMYAAGELDITYRVHVSKISHYKETGELHLTPQLGCLWVGFHCERPPGNDVKVRRALGLAINREEIGRIRGFGKGLESFGVVPPGMNHYEQQAQLFQEDIAEARRLLAEAGYPNGKGFPKVELLYYASDENRQIFEAVQAMWKRNLGIQVDLVAQEWKVYISLLQQGDFTIARHRWYGDYNDPTTMLSIFRKDDPCNYLRWSHPEFEAVMLRAQELKNEAERIKCLQEAERIFVREMPGAPVYWEASAHLVSHRVKGWYPNVQDTHPWKYISKLPAEAK
ncbi:MAG: peptide ABC transporter substrate-binding protein [Puniceicoccales bacterium]|jgi:oligopeptide transport system substrate-binding protein|nr:peptide ABC transporter substrate-binding protein [Puniceicoccales bacterium]